ncbi:hypothetical protein YB2330_005812 [Saitoella coloradoensis]
MSPPNSTLTTSKLDALAPPLKPFWISKYKSEAAKNWDLFYKRNTTNFFRDRHWLDREFSSILSSGPIVALEVGCGVGNMAFPALERNPELTMWCCDFSRRAVEFVKAHPGYEEGRGRCRAFVCDIAREALVGHVPPQSIDVLSCIFVLSAIPPELHVETLKNLASVLKPDGTLIFRDYATNDLAQLRFLSQKEIPKLDSNLYVRGDSTMSYFFEEEHLRGVMKECGEFVEEVLERKGIEVENRKRELVMERSFLQGVWRRK